MKIKFRREKISTVVGTTEVRYILEGVESLNPFQIIADRAGVRFSGESPTLMEIEEIGALINTLGHAWEEHSQLVPKLVTNPTGH